jgi:hypothetical protein
MTKKFLGSCFLSSPHGVDVSTLRKALRSLSIKIYDITNIGIATPWIHGINEMISNADFVCAVIPQGPHPNLYFELGMAYARNKPILVFTTPLAEIPSDIHYLTYIKSELDDLTLIIDSLRTFLAHSKNKPELSYKRARSIKKKTDKHPPLELDKALTNYEQTTASLLEDAGFIVSRQEQAADQGVDLAVWIDELTESLGNPILVEVKGRIASQLMLRDAAEQLRVYVKKIGGRCGLLIYWDNKTKEARNIAQGWPMVFCISGKDLTDLIKQKKFVKFLLQMRNSAFHGKA